MQLKFKRQQSIGQTITKQIIKILLVIAFVVFAIFLLEKINFPAPKEKIKIDISNEINKLK
ncbi:hypothetical protein JI56_01885 [SAR11 cluster bacterium PRT-SC02]|nr:hypothetical protein JI56_01885 [SAR11 cluster bacterium PRT-SC02]